MNQKSNNWVPPSYQHSTCGPSSPGFDLTAVGGSLQDPELKMSRSTWNNVQATWNNVQVTWKSVQATGNKLQSTWTICNQDKSANKLCRNRKLFSFQFLPFNCIVLFILFSSCTYFPFRPFNIILQSLLS